MKLCLNCMEKIEDNAIYCPKCGYDFKVSAENSFCLKPKTVLGERYILGTMIGSGGFGITYIGWDTVLSTKVAVKEFFPSGLVTRNTDGMTVNLTGAVDESYYEESVDKFLQEARILATCNDIPGVVSVQNYLKANNTAYIVMEYLEGQTLSKYLETKPEGKLSCDEAISMVLPVLNALSVLHEKNIIHRDISPDNIMILKNGDIKLLDFGAARQFASGITGDMSVIIKRGYAPPEQYRRNSMQDARGDIYAVGGVLYRMVTGKMPAESISRISKDPLVKPSAIESGIPKWVDNVILRAMSVLPKNRYSGAKEFREALIDSGKKAKRKKFIIIASAAAAVIVCCIAGFLTYKATIPDYYIECDSSTVDLHVGEERSICWGVRGGEYEIYPYEMKEGSYSIAIGDKDILDLGEYEYGFSDSIDITGKKVGKTTVTIDSKYAKRSIVVNVKEDEEERYPKENAKSAIFKVGSDIPAGEYVIFAQSSRGNASIVDVNGEEIVSEYFAYNIILSVSEGESLFIEGSYAVPINIAQVDTSGEGFFKVGDMIPPGKYELIPYDKVAPVYLYSQKLSGKYNNFKILDANDRSTLKIDGENIKYIKLERAGLKLIKEGTTDNGEHNNREWSVNSVVIGEETAFDINDSDNWNKTAEEVAGSDYELFQFISGFIILEMTDETGAAFIEKGNGTAEASIPCGDVEVIDEGEYRMSTLGIGNIKWSDDTHGTFTVTEPYVKKGLTEDDVLSKGKTFDVEIDSDGFLKFYYDYFDAVITFH